MATPEFVVLEVDVRRCAAEVFLNDIPVVLRGEDLGRSYRAPVNHLVVPGENRLTVVIEPLAGPVDVCGGPRARRRLSAEAEVRVALAGYPRGAITGGPDREELLALRWTPPARKLSLPRVAVASCGLGGGFGTWRWQGAPAAALEPTARDELLPLVSGLHTSLSAGQPKALLEASAPRVADIARAYGAPLVEKKLKYRILVMKTVSRSGWAMEPLDPDAVVLRPCAAGRLVEVLLADGKPALRDQPTAEGSQSFFPLTFAKLDDAWQIVR